MFKAKAVLALFLSVLLSFLWTCAISAASETASLEEIDRQILEKETELFSINTNFRAEYRNHEKWEQRRV